MKLLYYCWVPDPDQHGSYPEITYEKPDNVEVEESTGTWSISSLTENDPGFGKKFPIGGGKSGEEYRKLYPFSRHSVGCVLVVDSENIQQLNALANLAFHYGTQFKKPHPRTP